MATNTNVVFPPARRDPRQVVNTLKRILNFNDGDIAKASFANSLPAGAFIISVQAYVITAFNAGSTNPTKLAAAQRDMIKAEALYTEALIRIASIDGHTVSTTTTTENPADGGIFG